MKKSAIGTSSSGSSNEEISQTDKIIQIAFSENGVCYGLSESGTVYFSEYGIWKSGMESPKK